MFEENTDHRQEALFSPIKGLNSAVQKKLQNHWSTHFYEHVFTQIDERKFEELYHDGYSRPNKPVNELVSLEIIKHMLGFSDQQLEHAYLFDFRVRNALGRESLGDNICAKTFTNFRRRLMEFEEETGRDLLHEVFEDHRNYLQEEFDIDASTQRMDSTFIEANIEHLTRIDLIAKVVHNFLDELPEELVHDLPAGMNEFADADNLDLSYKLEPDEIDSTMETLVEHAAWLVDRFEEDQRYADLESFAHLQQVLDEQCYRIEELEEDEPDLDDDDDDGDHPGDGESPGWEPARTFASSNDETEQTENSDESTQTDEADSEQTRVGLKEADEIESGSLQNPHDGAATYRRKRSGSHCGYKSNVAETCDGENPFRLITTIGVDTNNTNDSDFLADDVPALQSETGLTDLLVDSAYTDEDVETDCEDHGITPHFTGLTGRSPSPETMSLAEAEWDEHRMVACPAGHEPFEKRYNPETGHISGRMDTEFCGSCPNKENCFVKEKQKFYSYGFSERKITLANRRKRLDDPAEEAFLNQRAGAESMIHELYHQDGGNTRFTGTIKVKNASTAKAIGTNLKRASRFLESKANQEQAAG